MRKEVNKEKQANYDLMLLILEKHLKINKLLASFNYLMICSTLFILFVLLALPEKLYSSDNRHVKH